MNTLQLPCHAVPLNKHVGVRMHRTPRIPDDNETYPLPPSLGEFPLHPVYSLPGDRERWRGRDFVVPIHQREAMWLSFDAPFWRPHALNIGIGGVDAISGEAFDPDSLTRDPQGYVVVPEQPWLDGINAGDGFIRQFVAVRLGEGLSVEAQVSGREEQGGLELTLFEPVPGAFPEEGPRYEPAMAAAAPCCMEDASMGLGAGGRMRQEIYSDDHPAGTWKDAPAAHVRIELVDAVDFAATTGLPVPATPVDAETYTRYGLPWFDLYDPVRTDVVPTAVLAGVRSIGELTRTEDEPVVVQPGQIITYVRNGRMVSR